MELRSQAVKHAAFGKGIITEVSGNTITVCFAQGEKRFPCPDAFSHHLTLKDAALLREMLGRLEGTPQAGDASAFYAYFCEMNQMMP